MPSSVAHPVDAVSLCARYRAVRRQSLALVAPLATEDFGLQAMPDASPPKWHLAHTTWFFETFLLAERASDYRVFHPQYRHLFNSYYDAVGSRFPRSERGLLSRPTVAEVFAYREVVDVALVAWLGTLDEAALAEVAPLVEIGLHHEQQHQELLLTDLKYAWSRNPLAPAYHDRLPASAPAARLSWRPFETGLREIGHDGIGFAFDNESPRHRVWLEGFALASRLVTNAEYRAFMASGGYDEPRWWLSDGWSARQRHGWIAPLYWQPDGSGWLTFTLSGLVAVEPHEPVTHVSFYEADAYARWAEARLPTEAEWETAAADLPVEGNFVESGRLHPESARVGELTQCFGDGWEWTASPYVAYPGYRPASGALGEYNGKFMCNQLVLRGGSCVSPRSHLRASYRNFFPPETRWQFSTIRLARDL